MADELLNIHNIVIFSGKKFDHPESRIKGIKIGGGKKLQAELDYLGSAASEETIAFLGRDHLKAGVTAKTLEPLAELSTNLKSVIDFNETPATTQYAVYALVQAFNAFDEKDVYGKYAQDVLTETAQTLGIENLKDVAARIAPPGKKGIKIK